MDTKNEFTDILGRWSEIERQGTDFRGHWDGVYRGRNQMDDVVYQTVCGYSGGNQKELIERLYLLILEAYYAVQMLLVT